MFVHPSQVADGRRAAIRRSRRARLVVDNPDGIDRMTLQCRGRDRRRRRCARRIVATHARGHQAARRGRVARAGHAAQRRQGDRRRAQATTSACGAAPAAAPCYDCGATGPYACRTRHGYPRRRSSDQLAPLSRRRCAPSPPPASSALPEEHDPHQRGRPRRLAVHHPLRPGEGVTRATRPARNRDRFPGPGEYVGEMSLDGGPRSASVITVEPTTCAVVNRAHFREFMLAHPDFALHLIEQLIQRVRVTTENVKSLALSDVYGRMVRLLNALAQPVGRQDGRAREADAAGHRRARRRVARHDQPADEGPRRRRLPRRRGPHHHLLRKLPTGW